MHDKTPRPSDAVEYEQQYLDGLFDHLDQEVARANARLNEVAGEVDPHTPDADALIRRETEYHGLQAKLDKLYLAELGLVFGRIDIDAPGDNPTPDGLDRRYIGRMGLDDRNDDYRTLLLDWRAPAARPYYLATTALPEGVKTRRNIRVQGRTVASVHDEALGLETSSKASPDDSGIAGESALLDALNTARTGHMHSIVETIQREQDAIIRDESRGVMVVEGGPGTGKTAVALHRVAYLLYTHRELLSSTGVLILGPNSTFLDYISKVLPALGETGVVLSTIGSLYPGVNAQASESELAREIKGSEAMADILRNAVRAYQVVPAKSVQIEVDRINISVTPATVAEARSRARKSRRPHNDARQIFTEALCEQLAQQLAHIIGADPLGGQNLLSNADIDQLHDDIAESVSLQLLLDELWPELSPPQVLIDLTTSRDFIAFAASEYDDETQEALYRESDHLVEEFPFAASDAALLDELAVLIGLPDPDQLREKAERDWQEKVREAQDALDVLSGSDSTDNDDDMFEAEILSAHDVIDAETLAMRQHVRDNRTTAERAAADHTWAYGHVIIDEAQELSPMEWRMVFRRCPSRWMTIVGDTAQTGSPAGVDSWQETLEPFVSRRIRLHQLTVNYRTPRPIAQLAHRVAQLVDAELPMPSTVREGAPVSWVAQPESEDSINIAPGVRTLKNGRLHATITAANVSVIKGLEFDHVTIVNPQEIVSASTQGLQNLYVAMTRATQTLTVVGAGDNEADFLEKLKESSNP